LVVLAGCASISERVAGTASESPLIGLPAGTPERPASPPPFPAVHDMPPARTNTVLTDAEQQKMEDDLMAARDRQQTLAGNKQALRKRPPPRPAAGTTAAQQPVTGSTSATSAPRQIPASSSRTIY
jgi:hypothetical protein